VNVPINIRLLSADTSLIVPIDHEVRILTTSMDVLHSIAIPSLGMKCDCIPGRLNQVSLYINRHGIFSGMCSELCGPLHANMPIQLLTTSLHSFLAVAL